MNPIDLTGARARLAAATPGPWRWYGDTETHTVYLATTHSGRCHVMGFRRWGMRGAQPEFQVYDDYTLPDVRKRGSHGMVALSELETRAGADRGPRFDVAPPRYRHDFVGIAHPDASFIEHSWADLRDALAEVDRVEAECLVFEKALVDIVNGRWSDGEQGAVERAQKALATRATPAAKEGAP